jgi:ATP cone domain-containing protein
MSLRRVRKRDGREVPFDEAKIRDAISKALAAAGEDDPVFASEVASVVRMTLEARYGSGPLSELIAPGSGSARSGQALEEASQPHIEEIQDLVEQALVELGRAGVAKAFILYRDRRARIRETLEVHRSPQTAERSARVRVTDAAGVSTWSKGRIVAALMNEAELPRPTAEEVAARVEVRVFDSGFTRLSTALIRELVDNELVALGLGAALRRQTSVLLPLYDLRHTLGRAPASPDPGRAADAEQLGSLDASERVSGEALRRFALEHVLDEGSAERHLAGEFHVLDLERPHLVLWSALPAELFLSGEPRALTAFTALEELARAAREASHGVVLENCGALLAPLARNGERLKGARRSEPLATWLQAVAAAAQAAHRRIDLCVDSRGERADELAPRLVEALGTLRDSPFLPRLFLDERELAALNSDPDWKGRADREPAQPLERLLLAGRVVPTWSPPPEVPRVSRAGLQSTGVRERFAAPGCHRDPRERAAIACGGAVALNLPRLALRAGPWREERFLEALAALVAAAITALESLHRYQESARASRPGELRGRVMFALSPVGLREALQLLGDGEIRPEQGARVLGFLSDVARRSAAQNKLSLALVPFFGERARVRFAELDGRPSLPSQQLLFGEGVGAGLEPHRPYSAGFRLSPVPGFVPWAAEAQLLSTVAVGALAPLPEDASRGGYLSLADAATRFFRLRRDVSSPFGFERESSGDDLRAPELFPEVARTPLDAPLLEREPAVQLARSTQLPPSAAPTPQAHPAPGAHSSRRETP